MNISGLFLALLLSASATLSDAELDEGARQIAELAAEVPIVVLGELHGTVEIPALVGRLAARLGENEALIVGLEIPAQEQQRLTRFLQSDGAAAARRRLLDGPFWKREHALSDGRRSVATLALIESLRQLRSSGLDVTIAAFDDEGFFDGRDRDAAMAQRLAELHRAQPTTRLLVLTGNYHARRSRPAEARVNGEIFVPPEPMTRQLQSQLGQTRLLNVNLGAASGAFWGCREGCGPIELPSRDGAKDAAPFTLDSGDTVFDYQAVFAKLSSSPPVPID